MKSLVSEVTIYLTLLNAGGGAELYIRVKNLEVWGRVAQIVATWERERFFVTKC